LAFAVLALTLTSVTPVQAQVACQFILGFKTLHDMTPDITGDCQDNQAFAANGDSQQHTTKGLMAWRKADNWTAFTNGYMTWINGPNGLVSRLNTDRFTWEKDQPPANPSPTSSSQQVADALPHRHWLLTYGAPRCQPRTCHKGYI